MASSPSPFPAPLPGPIEDIRDILASHWARLDEKSKRLRFLGCPDMKFFSRFAARIEPMSVIGVTIDGEVRGVCEVHRLRNAHAEIAISVEKAWQGHGYGRQLFEAGLREAADGGVETADLFFSAENRGIAHLVRSKGGEIRLSYGECQAEIQLGAFRAT